MLLENRRWSQPQLEEERRLALSAWPTGAEVDLPEAYAFHHSLAPERVAHRKLQAGAAAGRIFLQPRAGVALLTEHIELLSTLETRGCADFLPTTIDSYTRQNRYAEADRGIEESKTAGR